MGCYRRNSREAVAYGPDIIRDLGDGPSKEMPRVARTRRLNMSLPGHGLARKV